MAKASLSDADLERGPLIAVPDSLRLNAATAQMRLASIIRICDLPALERHEEDIQTGLLLAFERRKGNQGGSQQTSWTWFFCFFLRGGVSCACWSLWV